VGYDAEIKVKKILVPRTKKIFFNVRTGIFFGQKWAMIRKKLNIFGTNKKIWFTFCITLNKKTYSMI
jgi:hypothetical protein